MLSKVFRNGFFLGGLSCAVVLGMSNWALGQAAAGAAGTQSSAATPAPAAGAAQPSAVSPVPSPMARFNTGANTAPMNTGVNTAPTDTAANTAAANTGANTGIERNVRGSAAAGPATNVNPDPRFANRDPRLMNQDPRLQRNTSINRNRRMPQPQPDVQASSRWIDREALRQGQYPPADYQSMADRRDLAYGVGGSTTNTPSGVARPRDLSQNIPDRRLSDDFIETPRTATPGMVRNGMVDSRLAPGTAMTERDAFLPNATPNQIYRSDGSLDSRFSGDPLTNAWQPNAASGGNVASRQGAGYWTAPGTGGLIPREPLVSAEIYNRPWLNRYQQWQYDNRIDPNAVAVNPDDTVDF